MAESYAAEVLLAVLAVAWVAHLLRLAYISYGLRQRLRERIVERQRIARVLHDTLLQSVQALILQFQQVALEDRSAAASASMDRALDQAEEVLIETRDRVLGLRRGYGNQSDLPKALKNALEQIAQSGTTPCTFEITGEPRPVDPAIIEDVVFIAKEALFNASRHAGASSISVVLAYRPKTLVLHVEDDGCGIAKSMLTSAMLCTSGHFGLTGMSERAQRLGSRLSIGQAQPRGTTIELVVPSRMAYAKQPRFSGMSHWTPIRTVRPRRRDAGGVIPAHK